METVVFQIMVQVETGDLQLCILGPERRGSRHF